MNTKAIEAESNPKQIRNFWKELEKRVQQDRPNEAETDKVNDEKERRKAPLISERKISTRFSISVKERQQFYDGWVSEHNDRQLVRKVSVDDRDMGGMKRRVTIGPHFRQSIQSALHQGREKTESDPLEKPKEEKQIPKEENSILPEAKEEQIVEPKGEETVGNDADNERTEEPKNEEAIASPDSNGDAHQPEVAKEEKVETVTPIEPPPNEKEESSNEKETPLKEHEGDIIQKRKWFLAYESSKGNSSQNRRRTLRPDEEIVRLRRKSKKRGSKRQSSSDIFLEPSVTRSPSPSLSRNYDSETTPRNKVLRELIETEKDYIADLEIVVEFFIKPLRQKKTLSPKDIDAIFSNIEILFNIHKELVKTFDAADVSELMFGKIFSRVVAFLKIYTEYCANQSKSMNVLSKVRNNSDFSSLLKSNLNNPLCKNQNLESFLIKPIQRICKYPLLLRELVRHTESSHEDFEALQQVLQKINEIVGEVNENKRVKDNLFKLQEISEQLDSGELRLVDPKRVLIREGSVNLVLSKKSSQIYVFLFNDLLLLANLKKGTTKTAKKNYHLKAALTLNEITIEDGRKFAVSLANRRR